MTEEKCIVCSAPATKLCDGRIGGEICAYVRVGKFSDNQFRSVMGIDEYFTCDAPLCDEHAKIVGNVFFSGRKHSMDTFDRCPAQHPHPTPVTRAEADSIRRGIHAQLRRMNVIAV